MEAVVDELPSLKQSGAKTWAGELPAAFKRKGIKPLKAFHDMFESIKDNGIE